MRVADVRDDGDVRAHHLAEIADLTEMVHAGLDDGGLTGVVQAEERERRADVVVEVLRRFERAVPLRHDRGDHFLRRGLADRAGDLDNGDVKLPAVPRCERLERKARIGDGDVEFIGQERRGRPRAQAARRAERERLVDVVVSVEALAGERDKERALACLAAVGGNGGHGGAHAAREKCAARGGQQLGNGQPSHALPSFRARRELVTMRSHSSP